MSNVTVIQWGIVIGASLVAAVFDLRQRRIPNALTLPLVVTGLAYALLSEGIGGLGEALAACVLVSLPYVLLFVFAGGGAGDAKMMGAIGAWLGLRAGCVALVAVAVVGAIFGLANIVAKRQTRPALGRIGNAFYVMMVAFASGRKGLALLKANVEQDCLSQDRQLTIPYGPAIFIGVCIGAVVVHSWNG